MPLFDAPLAELAGPNDPPLSAPADQTRPSYQILELPLLTKPSPHQQQNQQLSQLTEEPQTQQPKQPPPVQPTENSQKVADFRPLQAALRNKTKDRSISEIKIKPELEVKKEKRSRRPKVDKGQQDLKKSLIIRKTFTPEPLSGLWFTLLSFRSLELPH